MSAVALNSNIASLNAQRRLGESTASLSRSFERLSSGLRINRASDDAAGLAIAASLNVDARVMAQGVRNINDGISLLNVAEGALDSLVSIVTRIGELATRSANGVYSGSQRQALDNEAQALSQEYNRIIATTSFNGIKLLEANQPQTTIETGTGTDQGLIAVGVAGGVSELQGTDLVTASISGSLAFNGSSSYISVNRITSSAITYAAWIKTSSGDSTTSYAGDPALTIIGDTTASVGNGFGVHGGKVRFSEFAGSWQTVDSSAFVNDGNWHHIAATYDNTSGAVSLYIDGSLDRSTSVTPGYIPAYNAIGRGYSGNYFDGSLGDVRIYNSTLSAPDIQTLASGSSPATSPLSRWQLDDGSGTTATDSAGDE